MMKLLVASTKFVRDEEGPCRNACCCPVAVVCIVAISTLGTSISDMFPNSGNI